MAAENGGVPEAEVVENQQFVATDGDGRWQMLAAPCRIPIYSALSQSVNVVVLGC